MVVSVVGVVGVRDFVYVVGVGVVGVVGGRTVVGVVVVEWVSVFYEYVN